MLIITLKQSWCRCTCSTNRPRTGKESTMGIQVCSEILLSCLLITSVQADSFENTIGMKMIRVLHGSFNMGYSETPLPKELTGDIPTRSGGDHDEKHYHNVDISHDFYMSTLEVTNKQFEMFNPSHKAMRGRLNFSRDDDEAVIFVSWYDTVEFCKWLSQKENKTYRLPTEAEWEYAARAGTKTYFNTGKTLPKEYWKCQENSWYPGHPAPCTLPKLTTNTTPPNSFGLCEMHGNVEEWTLDWYAFYSTESSTDPLGPSNGTFKVSRGGSHSTELYYLRSANRMGTLPEDNSWYIGFRVVMDTMPPNQSAAFQFMVTDYDKHKTSAKHHLKVELGHHQHQNQEFAHFGLNSNSTEMLNINRADSLHLVHSSLMKLRLTSIDDWHQVYSSPHFQGPLKYVNIPKDHDYLPFAHHNHDPGVCPCPNGDVFAIWYSTWSETTRELGIAYSRLPNGSDMWLKAEAFWNAPDRNDHAPAMYLSPNGTMYHFNGLSAAGTWGSLATIMRTSSDNGHTWSQARIIFQDHTIHHMPVETVLMTQDGQLLLPTDASVTGTGYTFIHLSSDMGLTWNSPPGSILGIHGAIVQLKNGSLYALGRGEDIDDHMAQSLSNDMGQTWLHSKSPFQGIHAGQREVLLRLKEGPIMMIGFANKPLTIVDASHTERQVKGLYTAVSLDEANTWQNFRLISDDGKGRSVETLDGHLFTMSYKEAEPLGYMSARQAPSDGKIHVISSRQHYNFNADWLLSPPPKPPAE